MTLQQLSNKGDDLKGCLEQREKQLSRLSREFQEIKRQLEISEERNQSLVQEKNELRRRLEAQHSEIGVASEDIQLMTKQNQSITSLPSPSVSIDIIR